MIHRGLILLSHGSRDPRPQAQINTLAGLIAQKMPDLTIGTAYLELAAAPLHKQISDFIASLGFGEAIIKILPLFLLSGNHVMVDIPREVAEVNTSAQLQVLPHLGSHPRIDELLIYLRRPTMAQAWILLAHGSKRPDALEAITELAGNIDALPAYWAVPPRLPERIRFLASKGVRSIGIQPYFLFSGAITEAITEQVESLQQEYPQLSITLTPPLGASPYLADLVMDLVGSY